jgi:hypothetical protein
MTARIISKTLSSRICAPILELLHLSIRMRSCMFSCAWRFRPIIDRHLTRGGNFFNLVSVPDLLLLHRKFVASADTRVTWRTRVASEIIRRNHDG